DGEVVGVDHGRNGRQHDDRGTAWMHDEVLQRDPGEGTDRHHDHDGDERRHRDDADEIAEHQDHEQEKRAGEEGGQPPAAAGFDVDDRLADHGTAGHAADETGGGIGDALA